MKSKYRTSVTTSKSFNQISSKLTDFITQNSNTRSVDWQHWSDCKPVIKENELVIFIFVASW